MALGLVILCLARPALTIVYLSFNGIEKLNCRLDREHHNILFDAS